MIAQGILPFKLERTEELITPRSGLVLFAEVIRALRVREKVEEHFPRPGSNRGYEAWRYIEPLLLMMEGGGRHVEDLREIEEDAALQKLLGLKRMPSTSTVGDWLARVSACGGVEAMGAVDEEVAVAIGKRRATAEYTLDVSVRINFAISGTFNVLVPTLARSPTALDASQTLFYTPSRWLEGTSEPTTRPHGGSAEKQFPMGVNFLWSFREEGLQAVLLPQARVFHAGGASTAGAPYFSRLEYRKSQLYFYEKHNPSAKNNPGGQYPNWIAPITKRMQIWPVPLKAR